MNYKTINSIETITVTSRAEWRQWLSENHSKIKVIWLVYYKKHTGKPSLTKADATEEAICFGWIDSLVRGIDDECYMQKFTPRKTNSIWSELNKTRVVKLESLGLIRPAGQVLIDYAKASGEWDKDRGTPSVVEMPYMLSELLEDNVKAQQAWNKLSSSHNKQYLLWITQAKREDTRLRRSKKVIKMLTSNQHPSIL